MSAMLPAGRPRMRLEELLPLARPLGLDPARDKLFVVGIQGYYRDTMGAPGVNDRGIYDDAIFLVSPSLFAAYNGNTDPSRVRKGSGFGGGKGMADLKPGLYRAHRFGSHRGKYLALIQTGGPVTVVRDGNPPYPDTGWFGINIHKGGFNTTSSLGCQTIHPSQWGSFIASAVDQAKRYYGNAWARTTIPYALLDGVPG
jgi:lysozyme